jgi:type IV secretory pathway VirB9-like protein
MKSLLTMILAISAAVAGAQTTGQGQIRHVETSMNHLTVLEFGEPVTTLAVGDADTFQIERHEDKVFIKPLQQGVSTNLFVWTASRELSYELDPMRTPMRNYLSRRFTR